MKTFRYSLILASWLVIVSCNQNQLLQEVKKFPTYPSGSGIEFNNGRYYLVGDDANQLLILDSLLTIKDSIQLYSFPSNRIPKPVKADLESVSMTRDNTLVAFGSGSLTPRNTMWMINPASKEKDSTRLDIFYQRLKESGVTEINIEGACSLPGGMLLANRGSKGYRKNQLIFTSHEFWKQQATAPLTIIPVGSNTDTSSFQGVSGLSYSRKTDRLLLTVSTEDTQNALEDGAIGKSYIWVVQGISGKKNWKAINPNQVIDLEDIDPQCKGQKIESVCITRETRNFIYAVLVADNDNGSSTVFRVVIEKD